MTDTVSGPGRDLDALVAEKVMNLPEVHWHPAYPDPECCVCEKVSPHAEDERAPVYLSFCGCDLDIDEPFGWDAVRTEAGHKWTCVEVVPRYSTSIADAWKVVEKMREHPNPNRRTLHIVSYPYNRTYATFDSEKGRDGDGWTEANGPHHDSMGICLAALEALAPTDRAVP